MSRDMKSATVTQSLLINCLDTVDWASQRASGP